MSKYHNLSKEELLTLVEKQESELASKKYGLVWDAEREPEQVVLDCEHHLPVLKRVKGKEIKTTSDQGDNILIEGDNYHALTVLNYTHQGKIDVIYIDPPYNTGNQDFKYNDKFVDREDGFRHSKWLNFMEKRLRLAKDLLSEEGLIFISIDDNEFAQLKLLGDKVFGENNFIDCLMVEMSNTGGMKVGAAKEGKITKNGEFVLIFSKSDENKKVERTPLFDFVPGFDSHFNLYKNDNGTVVELSRILAENQGVLKEFLHFGITPKKNSISVKYLSNYFDRSEVLQKFVLENKNNIVRPRSEVPIINNKLKINKNKWVKYETSKRTEPYYLTLDENNKIVQLVPISYNYRETDDFKKTYGRSVIRGDFWKGFWLDMGNISKEGDTNFENGKKPVRFIFQILKWAAYTNKSAFILDFFAGSGTTGHAVLDLNKEDGGNRRFILCTNNENNICEEVTYSRLQKVIRGYKKNGNGEKIEGLGGNLQYFKTDLIKKTKNKDQMRMDLTQKCTDMLCVKENIFNLESEHEDYKIFSSNQKDQFLCVYYNFYDESFDEFLKEVKKLKVHKKIYMFSMDEKTDKGLFAGVNNFDLEEIPQKIIEIYKQLVKMNIPVKAETIFLDFEKANKKVFEDKEKDEGARVLRIVLEKTIQKIAQKNEVAIVNDQGKEEKVSFVNDALKNAKLFTKVQWEENKTYLTIGNHASHGEYDEYDLKQVENFYKHVQELHNFFGI